MLKWVGSSLRKRFVAWTGATLLVVSLVFLVLLVGLYRDRLNQERKQASHDLNRLLQAALENAMLKRDLPGLREIVDRLGAQPGIRRVTILNPELQVRFASEPRYLGQHWTAAELGLCPDCTAASLAERELHAFLREEPAGRALRSVNPVHNKASCGGCHGPVAARPVNGLLVVDYDAASIDEQARRSAAALTAAGLTVMVLTLASGWWFMQRHVLRRVAELEQAATSLAEDRLDTRTMISGTDEFARLGRAFNDMAAHLQASLEAGEQKERFLQNLIDAIPDGIRLIATDYRVVMANAAFCNMHGRGREEVLAMPCFMASHGRSEPCPATFETCPLQQLSEETPFLKILARHARADGTPIDVEIFASALSVQEHGGKRCYLVESIRDLQQDVRYSQELKLSEVGRLATGVAHEIHNPLASVRIALQGSLRAIGQGRPDMQEIAEYLRLVDTEVDHCVEVTERLLKLGSASGRPQLVTINPGVRDTISLLRWEAAERGVGIDEHLHPDEPRVMAAEGDIRIVVLNLAQNALHAMPGGGTLTVTTDRRDGNVELAIGDTGSGIAREDLTRIFMPFFSRRADGVQGTGLGLSICRSIVEGLGGTIAVESASGTGSRFTVILPDADRPGAAV